MEFMLNIPAKATRGCILGNKGVNKMKHIPLAFFAVIVISMVICPVLHANEKDADLGAVVLTDLSFQSPSFMGSAFFDWIWFDATEEVNDEIKSKISKDVYTMEEMVGLDLLYRFENGRLTAIEGQCNHEQNSIRSCHNGKKSSFYSSDIYSIDSDEFGGYQYLTAPDQIQINIFGAKLKAESGQILFYLDDEPNVIRGKIFCFISLEKAKQQQLPYWFYFVGDKTLDKVFREEDLDVNDNGQQGWWLILDFAAEHVPFKKTTTPATPASAIQ